ncbi:glycosyltransferase family 4 protein [Aquifex aeolicus]|nr:glycosyltransferase family 1 protein [Aquifex aeolicus]
MNSIYIDGLFYKGSGIGRYYEFSIQELSQYAIIYIYVPMKFKNEFYQQFGNNDKIVPISTKYEKFSLKGLLIQSKILKSLENKVYLFFFPHINLPLYISQNTVVTVHDLRPFTEYWDRGEFKKLIIKKLFFDRAIKYSKAIISISKTTKNDLLKFYSEVQNKIVVIYETFSINKKSTETKQNIVGDYLLYVGQFKKHKNLDRLLKAFSMIKNKIKCKLVIAGKKDNIDIYNSIKSLNLGDRVVVIKNPSDGELINLYKNAKFFISPSLYEGFGLPPLESLNYDVPVILSDIPVFREIYEDIAIYFNPFSEENIAEKIIFALSNYNSIKQKTVSEKDKIFNKFEKRKIVKQYLELFNKIIKGELA